MTRRPLHLASVVLLAAVTVASTARVFCLLPCFTAQAAEAAAHCAHAASDDVDRVSAQSGSCVDCEETGLESADRLPTRHTATGPPAVTALPTLQPATTVLVTRPNAISPALPGEPSPGRAPVPLRI